MTWTVLAILTAILLLICCFASDNLPGPKKGNFDELKKEEP
jgi:hypothetical protein